MVEMVKIATLKIATLKIAALNIATLTSNPKQTLSNPKQEPLPTKNTPNCPASLPRTRSH
jgi:hypothetical protein